MHQLRALIWKSYKVRVRSPLSTALDLLGPIVIILLYVALKLFMFQSSVPQIEPQTKDLRYFRNVRQAPLNLRQEIRQYMCPKILYYSAGGGRSSSIETVLQGECGFELARTSDRRTLVTKLRQSLDRRMLHQQQGVDLNKSNSTNDNCISLPNSSNEPIYQIGLVQQEDGLGMEIYSTDFASSTVIHQPYSQGSPYNEYTIPQSDLNQGAHLIEICIGKAFSRGSSNATDRGDINWRFMPYPVITGIYVVPMSTAMAIIFGGFCTSIATVLRISEANENGLHRYIRIAGLPACYYWLSLESIAILQVLIQSLITSILLAIPTGNYISDPISDASVTLRWAMIFLYSLASNSHATFVASLFNRSSQALLVLCSLGSMYAMYPLLLLVQWTPYGWTRFFPLNIIALYSPVATLSALCQVVAGVALQTNQDFGWIHLGDRIINGGMTQLSTAELMLLLLIQSLIYSMLTVLIDQYRYCTANNFVGFLCAFVNEICCCNYCCAVDNNQTTEDIRTKSAAPVASRIDPNRLCCSIRHVNVHGETVMVPFNRGNPLRFSREQMQAFRNRDEERTVSKTTEYLINRKHHGAETSKLREEPILLDEAIKQNITWYSTEIKFVNLELDFRFNQISFVLGQTSLKELLFDCVLGLRALDSGHIIIDGIKYTSTNLNLARRQIGYLSDKDIFYNQMTIFENLQFFGSLRQSSYKSYDTESLYILNLLHLSSRRNNEPSYLTHRSARKLALGVAAVGHTKLLLLIEPTANLHWRPRCQVYNLLKKYKAIRSIVIDSSDVDEAVAFGDRIIMLKNASVNMNDTPARLEKRQACGYWIVFMPASGDGRSVNSGAIKALEKLTSDVFRADKIDLDTTKRSIYHKMNAAPGGTSNVAQGQVLKSGGSGVREPLDEDIHKVITVVKVRHTNQSTQALCTLLRMFASKPHVHGFRLAHLSYESLEDVLVLSMSRAVYPDLPPDLLLSLQHRTQASTKTQEQSPISVRRMTSYATTVSRPEHSSNGRPIFASNLATIVRDRLSARSEIITTMTVFLGSLIVILISLIAMQNSLDIANQRLTPTKNGPPPNNSSSFQLRNAVADGGGGAAASAAAAAAAAAEHHQRRDKRDHVETTTSMVDTLLNSLPWKNRYLASYDEKQHQHVHYKSLPMDLVERLYKYRIGLYIIGKSELNSSGSNGAGSDLSSTVVATPPRLDDLRRWNGNDDIVGTIDLTRDKLKNLTDAEIVAGLIRDSKDLASSLVAYNPSTNEATVIFEPYLPHVMMASIKKFIDYNLTPRLVARSASRVVVAAATAANLTDSFNIPETEMVAGKQETNAATSIRQATDRADRTPAYTTSTYYFNHPWHEMIMGYTNRRMIYGVAFAIAESMAMGALVLAPIRHRGESRLARVRAYYWFSMATFDMMISLPLIAGYILLFVVIENMSSLALIASMFIVLFAYKLASLPIPYTVSIAAEQPFNGFLFIALIYVTISWVFAIYLRTFVEWTLITQKYLYTVANWILFGLPISALIDSLTVIGQVNNMRVRCRDVPAYTRTVNRVEIEGVRRVSIMEDLLDKVRECLASGKTSIDTNVMHQQSLGILWFIYLIILFGLISWTFLLTSESFFGIVARRFNSARTSGDPMKTIVRLPDATGSQFKWDKERDRLISEYIKCMNEIKYVKCMAANCLILRIWLRPMGDQTSIDRRLSSLLDPLFAMGHTKNDIQVELRTTLQMFIRIGDESRRCRVDKTHLIETYTKYTEQHSDSVSKIAVVDWTRENLYKILLHGHYNTKISTAI